MSWHFTCLGCIGYNESELQFHITEVEVLNDCQNFPPWFKSMIHDPVITSWDSTRDAEDLKGLENGGFHGKQVTRSTGNEVNAWCWAQIQDMSNNAIWESIKKQAEAIYGCDCIVGASRASISADWSTKANRQKRLSCLKQLGLPKPDHIQNWCHYTITQLVCLSRQNMGHHRCHCSVSAPSSNPFDGPITCMSICLVYLSFLRWSNSVQPPSCSHKSRINLLAAHQSASKDVR